MPNEQYTPERIRSMYGQSEIDLKFPTPIPVNITYQTAFVDDAGKLQFRKDVYGRDATMIDDAERTAAARISRTSSRIRSRAIRARQRQLPDGVAGSQQWRVSGPTFFERLFGAPTPPPAPVGRRPQQQRVFTR